ncbi:MAG: Gfo/Idh/MocA family oxidoreductase [Clostridia bacterium]|nr:Gfo/Idh/MocA family oxidoreductase [Clostridia bacterium]
MKKINIGIIGLGFGKEFIPIYQRHPNVEQVAICTRNPDTLRRVGEAFGIPEELRFTVADDMIACSKLDAIHVVTPVYEHAPQVLKVLNAGKHAACTIPMALTVGDCAAIAEAAARNRKIYMMMETAVHTREYRYLEYLRDSGALGRIQFLRSSHIQDMEGWAGYWRGLPPFYNGTHAISPLSCFLDRDIDTVTCHGSGRVRSELEVAYGSPFAVESCTLTFDQSDVCAETTRSLYDTVRQYRESFDVYGSKCSWEWEQVENEGACLFKGGESARRVFVPEKAEGLPGAIQCFTLREEISDTGHLSFLQGAGHGGSHPYLAHAFVSSVVEGREPYMNATRAANITCAGILAHGSAMAGGKPMKLPAFTRR